MIQQGLNSIEFKRCMLNASSVLSTIFFLESCLQSYPPELPAVLPEFTANTDIVSLETSVIYF